MFPLRCTVRGCEQALLERNQGLGCSAGHHFDRAKAGYWSLLQPQDRKSLQAGDSDDAVLARQRWLERGHMDGLVDALRPWIADSARADRELEQPKTIDLGCGEGSFGSKLCVQEPEGYCGIDLSKRAVRLAARRWPEATWVLANADRVLPVFDESVDRAVSLFGRRPEHEISRVLKAGRVLIVAVPGEEDLIELREQVQETGIRRSRWEPIAEGFEKVGLRLEDHQTWRAAVTLEPEAIADALAMTYRAVRHSQKTRMESLDATRVTLAADLMLFRKAA